MATSTGTQRDATGKTRTRSPAKKAGFSQGAIIGVAAAGLIAGLVASMGRKVAVQASSAMTGDWLDTLRAEHAATLKLFDKLLQTTNSQTTKRSMLLMQIKHALAKHAFEEENVIYPALRDHQEQDDADHLTQDHGYVKQYLYDLTHIPRGSDAWLTKATEFRTALEKHIREEEDTIFPALHRKLDKEESGSLTTEMTLAGFKLA